MAMQRWLSSSLQRKGREWIEWHALSGSIIGMPIFGMSFYNTFYDANDSSYGKVLLIGASGASGILFGSIGGILIGSTIGLTAPVSYPYFLYRGWYATKKWHI